MARRVAIYPGSFDPFTLGHVDLVTRGCRLFDELIVAVGNNPAKRTQWFDVGVRMALAREACEDCANVRVVSFSGLLVHAARELGASVILRGIRTISDVDAELRDGIANRHLTGIETLYLPSDPALAYLSSSLVRDIASHGGEVAGLVPVGVLSALQDRSSRETT